jgi:hypothetical protein
MLAGGRPGEEAKSQVIGELCDKVFSLRLWLFVPFVAAFNLYCLNHRDEFYLLACLIREVVYNSASCNVRKAEGFVSLRRVHFVCRV